MECLCLSISSGSDYKPCSGYSVHLLNENTQLFTENAKTTVNFTKTYREMQQCDFLFEQTMNAIRTTLITWYINFKFTFLFCI